MMRFYCALAVWAVCAASSASAGDELRRVPARAEWFLHVDVAAAARGSAGPAALGAWLGDKDQKAIADMLARFDLQLTRDVRAMTVFRTGPDVPAVSVLTVPTALDRVLKLVVGLPSYGRAAHGAHSLHTWVEEETRYLVAVWGRSTLLMGQSVQELKRALDVLDGVEPNAEEKRTFTHLLPTKGQTASFGAARSLRALGLDGVLGDQFAKADSAFVAVGERDRRFSLLIRLNADPAVAQNLGDILRGLQAATAISTLFEKPELGALVQKISIRNGDGVVQATLKAPSSEVVAYIEAEL